MSPASAVRFVDLAKPPRDRARTGHTYPNVAQSKDVPDRKQSEDLLWKFKTLSAASLEDLSETSSPVRILWADSMRCLLTSSKQSDEDPLPQATISRGHTSKLARIAAPMALPARHMLLCTPPMLCASQSSSSPTDTSSDYSSSSSGSDC
ncbi:hypothetical protein VNI00_001833 [Paramarasmius palmivorus]|uniref:Uncharacterized protein n=1 Tax=Paramarasmius palmivorus TaxID=297713 RepID=A0AAW0E3N6_9AGAR